MRLLLVRHGQTAPNIDQLLDTDEPGAGLTELGLEQAAALPNTLVDEPIDVLYASTLVRTQQTAAPLAASRGLEVRVRGGLREVRAGTLEMRGDAPAVQHFRDAALAWSTGEVEVRLPGAESGAEVFGRYDEVIGEIAGLGVDTAVVVSHGTVIRTWAAARARNVTPAFAAGNPLTNTGVVVLEGSPRDGWAVLTWDGRALAGTGHAVQGPATTSAEVV
ncbi:MAG: histidine phosphatase family protein [Cellulomonas sp.]